MGSFSQREKNSIISRKLLKEWRGDKHQRRIQISRYPFHVRLSVQKYDIFWLGPYLSPLLRIPTVSSSSSLSMTGPDVQDCKTQDNYRCQILSGVPGTPGQGKVPPLSEIGKQFYDNLKILFRFYLLLYPHIKGRHWPNNLQFPTSRNCSHHSTRVQQILPVCFPLSAVFAGFQLALRFLTHSVLTTFDDSPYSAGTTTSQTGSLGSLAHSILRHQLSHTIVLFPVESLLSWIWYIYIYKRYNWKIKL